MFNNKDNGSAAIAASSSAKLDTLLGKSSKINGDVTFNGILNLDGKIIGSVASSQTDDVLRISETGLVEGKVEVANIIINGKVKGDIVATGKIEIASKASVEGNVYYTNIEMEAGSRVNGQLIYQETQQPNTISKIENKKTKQE